MPNNNLSINVSFLGDSVRQVLEDHADMTRSVWDFCSRHANANIKVYVTPRTEPADPLDWSISVASPAGRNSFTASQRKPLGAVSFTPAPF